MFSRRLVPTACAQTAGSEVLTLAVAQHWLGIAQERKFLRFIRNNHLPLFPRFVDQSQFNRRARALCWLMRVLYRHLIAQMDLLKTPCQLIDGTPVQVRHWRRFGKGHLLWPEASLGYCAAKKETYYGFRLLAVAMLEGIIVDWNLFAANADERVGAQEMLESHRRVCVLGDKGFLDQERQILLHQRQGVSLLTPKRRNQKQQNPQVWDAAMNRARRVIETTFSQAKSAFGLEKPGACRLRGLQSRLIAKITGLTLAACHNVHQGHSPLRLAEFSFHLSFHLSFWPAFEQKLTENGIF